LGDQLSFDNPPMREQTMLAVEGANGAFPAKPKYGL